jgi:hypothetical protein
VDCESGTHALVLVFARSGDAVNKQADEARMPHLARKCARRGGVLGGGSTSSSARTAAMAVLVRAEEVGEEALAVAHGDVGGGVRAGR